MAGIKETKEAIDGLFAIGQVAYQRFKDGVGVDDAIAIWDKIRNDDEFRDTVTKAYQGWEAIPGEIGDLDAAEAIELAVHVARKIPGLLSFFKS